MAGKETRTPRVGRIRQVVKLIVFAGIVVGLFVAVGWGSLSSMGIDAIAYLCPLGSLEVLLASKTAIPRFVIVLVAMLALVALLGRAFCSWACPVPPVEAFFRYRKKGQDADLGEGRGEGEGTSAPVAGSGNGLREGEGAPAPIAGGVDELHAAASSRVAEALSEDEKALLTRSCAVAGEGACASGGEGGGAPGRCAACLPPVGGKRDRALFDTRHGVLLGALASAALFGFPVFCLVCPVGLSIATVVALWQLFVGHAPSWSLLVFPLIVLVEVVFFRKWCHALCPMGALMSLIGRKSLFKPRVAEGKCLRANGVDCKVCVNACPELLDPHSSGLAECTKCGICVDRCPAKAISMPALRGKGAGD